MNFHLKLIFHAKITEKINDTFIKFVASKSVCFSVHDKWNGTVLYLIEQSGQILFYPVPLFWFGVLLYSVLLLSITICFACHSFSFQSRVRQYSMNHVMKIYWKMSIKFDRIEMIFKLSFYHDFLKLLNYLDFRYWKRVKSCVTKIDFPAPISIKNYSTLG